MLCVVSTGLYGEVSVPQVYCQNIPLAPALPSSLPPYAPVSQPTVQFIMQGSLPALGCVAGQSLTPEPGSLATASEPGIQAASVGSAEEKIKAPKPPVDKTKNEEVSECIKLMSCLFELFHLEDFYLSVLYVPSPAGFGD